MYGGNYDVHWVLISLSSATDFNLAESIYYFDNTKSPQISQVFFDPASPLVKEIGVKSSIIGLRRPEPIPTYSVEVW